MKAHAKALDRAKMDSEKIYKRIGHKALYMRILEDGYFEVSGISKLEAALNAGYLDVIRLISINNAKTV